MYATMKAEYFEDWGAHYIMERKIFKSGNISYDVDILSYENSYTFRFYESGTERWDRPLSDLVIVPSSYGFLFLKFIADGAVVGGFLDKQHFSKDMVEDIMLFIEDSVPACKDIYLPYHIDFVVLSDYDEYNGEY